MNSGLIFHTDHTLMIPYIYHLILHKAHDTTQTYTCMQKLSDQCLFRAMAEMTMRRIKKTTEIDAATTAVLAVWQKSPNC